MPWYMLMLLICLIVGPFDALYMYIKAERRKEERRKRKAESQEEQKAKEKTPSSS